MRRRDFLVGLAAVPVAAALPATAQAHTTWPYLYVMDAASGPDMTAAWRMYFDPITDSVFREPISVDEFYKDF